MYSWLTQAESSPLPLGRSRDLSLHQCRGIEQCHIIQQCSNTNFVRDKMLLLECIIRRSHGRSGGRLLHSNRGTVVRAAALGGRFLSRAVPAMDQCLLHRLGPDTRGHGSPRLNSWCDSDNIIRSLGGVGWLH